MVVKDKIVKTKSSPTPIKKSNYSKSYNRPTSQSKDLLINRELMKTQETKIVNQMIAHFKKLNSKKKTIIKKTKAKKSVKKK